MIKVGNVHTDISLHPENRGWIAGEFLSPDAPLFSPDVQIKWVEHHAGDIRQGSHSEFSQVSIDIMLEGTARFSFPETDEEYTLSAGDYITYDTSLCTHTFQALTDTRHIVVRTPPKHNP